MKIGIAFFVKNCLEYTQACLSTLKTKHKNVILVVDDFSTDGTKEWLAETQAEFQEFANSVSAEERNMQGFLIVENLPVESLGARWNHAMRLLAKEGCEAVLLCNNDILFHPETVNNLVDRLESGKKDPLLSVVMVTAHNLRGHIKPEVLADIEPPRGDEVSEAPHPDFSCMLLDIEAWRKVGGFAEEYVPCYYEDNDFHTMLKIHGLVAINTTAAPYYHYGSITQNQKEGGLCTGVMFRQNKDRFVQKFGAMPDELDIEELRDRFLE
jgi:GT2 family glycosyltransferase